MMRWSIFALVWCAAGSARAQPPPAVEPGTAPVAEPGTGPVAEPAPAAEPVAPPVTASEAEAAPVPEAASRSRFSCRRSNRQKNHGFASK